MAPMVAICVRYAHVDNPGDIPPAICVRYVHDLAYVSDRHMLALIDQWGGTYHHF